MSPIVIIDCDRHVKFLKANLGGEEEVVEGVEYFFDLDPVEQGTERRSHRQGHHRVRIGKDRSEGYHSQ